MELNTPLQIEEIDFRIQSINKGGYATILAYKDARVDMNRLDEVLGPLYWQKKYEIINSNLFCSIGIYNKNLSTWVWKQDVGVESMAEKQKGEASDAFKRAAFNCGIGRELYSYPVIKVKLNTNEFKIIAANGSYKERVVSTWDLKLKEWNWSSSFEGNKITSLTARDDQGNVRFSWKAGANNQGNVPTPKVLIPKNPPVKKRLFEESAGEPTKAWLRVLEGIKGKKLLSVEDVEKHYLVGTAEADKLNELFK